MASIQQAVVVTPPATARRLIVDQLRQDNAILSHMPDPLFELIANHLTPEFMPLGVVIAPLMPVRSVDFPLDGLFAMVTLLSDGATIEAASGGRHGLHGVSVIMDGDSEATELRVVIAGSALRIPAPFLRATMELHPALRTNLARIVPMLMARMSWTNACSARHSIEQRAARWLLCASADIGSPVLAVTQEVVAAMLGVRRAGISEIFCRWGDADLVTTHRSQIAIKDLPGLETRACECYREDQRARGPRSAEFAAPTPERAAAVHGLIRRYAALSGKTLVPSVN